PVLVYWNPVFNALNWLCLNHSDYHDITISHENLACYPEDMPSVFMEYKERLTKTTPLSISVYDNEEKDSVEDSECPFIVHGLTGKDLETMTSTAMKSWSVLHLNSNGKVLAIGHSAQSESIWNNPQLYPKMFLWLFPYGKGGIGDTAFSDNKHKKLLMMYHNK
ncbi:hypothetical protein EV421DRAFT_1715479, partial [Armillaria borealis]